MGPRQLVGRHPPKAHHFHHFSLVLFGAALPVVGAQSVGGLLPVEPDFLHGSPQVGGLMETLPLSPGVAEQIAQQISVKHTNAELKLENYFGLVKTTK